MRDADTMALNITRTANRTFNETAFTRDGTREVYEAVTDAVLTTAGRAGAEDVHAYGVETLSLLGDLNKTMTTAQPKSMERRNRAMVSTFETAARVMYRVGLLVEALHALNDTKEG